MTPIIGRDLVHLAFAWFAAAAFAVSLGYFLYAYLFLFGPPPSAALPAHSALAPSASAQAPAGTVYGPSLVNLALFTVFALHHSLFARTGFKQVVRRLVPASLERAFYSLVASLLFILVCWAWRPVEGMAWALPGVWRWVGFAAQAAGIVMTLLGARALDVLDLAGVRQVMPVSGPAQPLKTDGVYGFVRHPLYFAWLLMVFGAPDMTMTRLTFAVISTIYLAIAIPFEERSLIETFGADYSSYRRKVRWRMIPGLY
jgi:protein-S-isoprenylcysteine O-methyltransferase Ste14